MCLFDVTPHGWEVVKVQLITAAVDVSDGSFTYQIY